MDQSEIQTPEPGLSEGHTENSEQLSKSYTQTSNQASEGQMMAEERLHTSAFRYHGEKAESFNTLQYFTALKKAKSLVSPEGYDVRKRKNLDRGDGTNEFCDIFQVQRPSTAQREGYVDII